MPHATDALEFPSRIERRSRAAVRRRRFVGRTHDFLNDAPSTIFCSADSSSAVVKETTKIKT